MAKGALRVFEYADYRRYLADYYAHAKAGHYGFSFRVFSRRAGIRSSNYLRLVIDGARNLTPAMAERFAVGCELAGNQAAFFCDLVAYSQAKTTREREQAYRNLLRYRSFRATRKLDAAEAAYHSTWYLPAIRELVRLPEFSADPAWIAAQLLPRIGVRDAERGLALLLELGLLVQDERGRLRQTDPVVTTGPGPLGHHIFTYHHTMLARAGAALDELDRDERDVSCITVAVSQARFEEFKQRVRALRRELLHDGESEVAPERVVQINFQVFPLSEKATSSSTTARTGAAGDAGPRRGRPRNRPRDGRA